MSGTPINLNKARKARARAAKKARAEENVVVFGLTKAQKSAAKSEADQQTAKVDGHRRDETPS